MRKGWVHNSLRCVTVGENGNQKPTKYSYRTIVADHMTAFTGCSVFHGIRDACNRTGVGGGGMINWSGLTFGSIAGVCETRDLELGWDKHGQRYCIGLVGSRILLREWRIDIVSRNFSFQDSMRGS